MVETGLNYQGIPTLENAAYEFETDTWGKLLVISLEFAPRDEAIEWAAKVAGKAKYKNHKVILLTHSYMSPEAKRHIKESYKISPANYGEAIWQKLVYPSSNICMVICGHECEIAPHHGVYAGWKDDQDKDILPPIRTFPPDIRKGLENRLIRSIRHHDRVNHS